jgi:hypothetical protein
VGRYRHWFETSRFGGTAEITGYRDQAGEWNQVNPRTGRWYTGGGEPGAGTRHRGHAPTPDDLAEGREFSVAIRYRGKTYHYTYHTPIGITGRELERDFKHRIRAGYFRRHGTRRAA